MARGPREKEESLLAWRKVRKRKKMKGFEKEKKTEWRGRECEEDVDAQKCLTRERKGMVGAEKERERDVSDDVADFFHSRKLFRSYTEDP